ncbi:MAG: hypothetical protein PHD67_08020 [Oscillospiraceae bacterium]|nr:hypothetical protein [Oscillospiraceae bacterium]
MKARFLSALTLVFCLLLAGCSENGSGNGVLNVKEICGAYEGSGSATKYEVERIEADITNQRNLFVTGDRRETGGNFDGIVITFEDFEGDGKSPIWYRNGISGGGGELSYNADSGQWEGRADYPLGTLSTVVTFTKDTDGIHATFVLTQTFEREHFENPKPSDGVNEFTLSLTKTK